MKVIADDKIPFLKGVLEPFAKVTYLPGNKIDREVLSDADVLLVRSITICDEALLAGSSVKLIASATIGDDHIDKQFCNAAGISWRTAKGCNANAVVQYVTSALLAVAESNGIELSDRTLGIIGVGDIGSKVAMIGKLLGMQILLNDPPREKVEGGKKFSSLEVIREKADFITLHVPLTFGGEDKTFHLLGVEFFRNLKNKVVLINTSRGAVIETDVLKMALKMENINSLILDVWENEPEIDTGLMEMAALATPHIAGYSLEGKANGTAMVVRAVSAFMDLPLKNWSPDLPAGRKEIRIDCKGLRQQEILAKLFDRVYPVYVDSENFKSIPGNFEEFRRDYLFRRENKNFEVQMIDGSPEVKKLIEKFGFKIKS